MSWGFIQTKRLRSLCKDAQPESEHCDAETPKPRCFREIRVRDRCRRDSDAQSVHLVGRLKPTNRQSPRSERFSTICHHRPKVSGRFRSYPEPPLRGAICQSGHRRKRRQHRWPNPVVDSKVTIPLITRAPAHAPPPWATIGSRVSPPRNHESRPHGAPHAARSPHPGFSPL